MNRVSVKKIEEQVSLLSLPEQLRLIERLIHRMRKPEKRPATSWQELYGIGKGVWHGQDAQEYAKELREDRP